MELHKHYANALRALAMDSIDKAKSGHPGAPMGMADMAEALWRGFLKHDPSDPAWFNRDRFILSNGHASALLYSLLHLTGYRLSIDELKKFRQFGSLTPGHPESDLTPGVDMGSGPLGQGIATAVGFALAEKLLAARFNRDGYPLIDHYTYVFMGDGCLMEGVSQEAISLAGTWRLGKLVAFYDSNNISIDGSVSGWFTDDTAKRFEACGWQVLQADGHDHDAVSAAIVLAQKDGTRPSLIICRTTIGYGSPHKAGSASCHGSPLGPEETAAAKKSLGWEYGPFEIPEDIYRAWDARDRGAKDHAEWDVLFERYSAAYPDEAAELKRRISGALPDDFGPAADTFIADMIAVQEKIATRASSLKALNAYAPHLPELLGGSADLTPSNQTMHSCAKEISADDFTGNYIHYGVREFAMSTVMNGVSLHGGFIPYGGFFLCFADYARNAIRMAALLRKRSVWVLTHDSIGVGEDGPTHQPVEQISSFRLTPNVRLWRPCDTVETAVAWKDAIMHTEGPVVLALSRQGLPPQQHEDAKDILRGGYVLSDCDGTPDLIFIATGSEVSLAVKAAGTLSGKGVKVRVVSMPCTDLFDVQDDPYKESVLPPAVRKRIAVEAASEDYWYKYVGLDGKVIGMKTFGLSAPATTLFEHFGFTEQALLDAANELLAG